MTFLFNQNYCFRPRRRWFIAIFATLIFTDMAYAARIRGVEEDKSKILSEVLENLRVLRHEVANHEAEIHIFEEKFKTQEEIIDSLGQQLSEAVKAIKEALEIKIAQQEHSSKGLTSNLKTFSTESTAALAEYKQRITELEKTIAIQNRNLENMQTALRSLTEAWQDKGDKAEGYIVKSGDSLEKIARRHQTTIKKLKEANNLVGDQIIIGQKLQIPDA